VFVIAHLLLALAQSASGTSVTQTPSPPPAASPADPARLTFPSGSVGLVLVAIKPDHTGDYEAAIHALHAALAADAGSRPVSEGWKVFKALEADAKGNAVYVHVMATPVPEVDYRPSAVVGSLGVAIPEDVLVKYRDAFAAPPSRLSLSMLADLALAPLPKPEP
jgi:hypothetical protein